MVTVEAKKDLRSAIDQNATASSIPISHFLRTLSHSRKSFWLPFPTLHGSNVQPFNLGSYRP